MTTTTPSNEAAVATFAPSSSKLARIEVLDAWLKAQQTSLLEQDADDRTIIKIGSFVTYWSRGLSPNSPPYLVTANNGARYLLLWIRESAAVYENFGRVWTRRAVLKNATEILAALPARAHRATLDTKPATEKQIAALRKLLDVPVDETFPEITSRRCSRLLDRLTIERAIEKLRADFENCATAAVTAAAEEKP